MSPRVAIDTAKLDALFAPFNRVDRPGLAVGVAHRNAPVYRKGFGLANVELPIALSPSIRIRIGSTTKHFLCLCVMLLAEEGKLSPRDSVRRFIPELKDWAEPVSLAALMSHTGGVRCSLDILSTTSRIMQRPLPHAEQLKLLCDLESANFAPGAEWMYSNGGYVLLTEVVRRLSNASFEDFLRERVLAPIGMDDTLARPVDTDLLPNSATPHVPNAKGGFDRGVFGPDIGGEGSMVSTVDDMLRWLRHMRAPTIGTQETWAEMRTPVVLRSGISTGYGYGLAVSGYRGVTALGHGGTVIGGNCQMFTVLDHDLDVIILTNVSGVDVNTLGEQVIEACFADLAPAEPAPDPELGLPEGAFFARSSGRHVKIVKTDGGFALDFDGAPYPLSATPGRPRFWLRTNMKDGASLRRVSDDAIEVEEFGTDRLERVAPPDRPEAPEIVGAYEARDIRARARVSIGEDDSATFRVEGPYGSLAYSMRPIAPGVWLLKDPAANMSAVLEREGARLLFSSTRSRRLRFEPLAPSGEPRE